MFTGPRLSLFAASVSLVASSVLMTGCGENKPDDGFDIEDGAFRGELAIYMSNDSDGRSDTFYALRAPSGIERRLVFDVDASELVPGAELKVWGTETLDGLRVASFRVISPPIVERTSALKEGPAFKDRAFAFVLLDTGAGVNVTSETVMNRMINDANSIRNYYLYDSYGRQNISAQVFGPISFSPASACDSNGAAKLRSMITGTFQHYLWYFGSKQGCSWSGLASLGTAAAPSKDTWYNASTGCVVLVQEPGHNFGMQHSSSIRCSGTPLADDTLGCTASEYGDPMDPMGGGCRHMNAWQKSYQGWFGGCNGVNVTSSGTFKLLPFEMRCDGAQFLKIKAPKTRSIKRSGGGGGDSTETLDYYYVELRTPLDFDGTLGGSALTPRVLLHVANDTRSGTQPAIHPYIIDMTPATTSFSDAGFAVGQTFTDPAGGLTITATAVSATEATITVSIPGGTGGPTCLDNTPFPEPNPGTESCIANTATPVGNVPTTGTGGANGTGTGGRAGTGGAGAGGRVGTGGSTVGTGGTPGTGGRLGTGGSSTGGSAPAGSGGANSSGGAAPLSTGGATLIGTGGATAAGGSGPGTSTGGAVGPTGPGAGPTSDVVGGCACAMNAAPTSGGTLATGLGGMLLLLLARRRRPVRASEGRPIGR